MKYIKTYEGLFDFFKKKKPVRELPTEILYEPMNAVVVILEFMSMK